MKQTNKINSDNGARFIVDRLKDSVKRVLKKINELTYF